VARFVAYFHLVADPLGIETLEFFVSKTFVVWNVRMGFVTGKLFAMGVRVGRVA
jgi:hypothetical protein